MSLVLTLAAALNAQPAPAPCIPDLQAKPVAEQQLRPCSQPKPILMAFSDEPAAAPPTAERTPNLYRQPAACGSIQAAIAERQDVAMRGQRSKPLYAVDRRIEGCGVAAPMGYRMDYLLPAEPAALTPAGGPPRRR